MKKILLATTVYVSILFSLTAQAEFTQQKCDRFLKHSGDILIQRTWDTDSRNCFVSIHPMNIDNMKYRDYYFDNSGLFMVFNSYGDGSTASTTGARVFYLLPKIYDYPDFSIEPNGDVLLRTVSGHLFLFDSVKFGIKTFSPGSFTEQALSKTNKGGVEIKPTAGYWLDAGWKMGGMATDSASSKTAVYGSRAGQCSLVNKEIYAYNQGYNHPLLLEGQDLDLFFQRRCNIQF